MMLNIAQTRCGYNALIIQLHATEQVFLRLSRNTLQPTSWRRLMSHESSDTERNTQFTS